MLKKDGSERKVKKNTWLRTLGILFSFYFLGYFVLVLTGNPTLFPTVIMLGCFMIPITYVNFFYDHRHLSLLTPSTIASCFVYGGLLGVFSSALLEPLFIRRFDYGSSMLVGLIEELSKILGVLLIARHRRHDQELDGIILGAAAGMGFASFESTGYAFNEFLRSHGNVTDTMGVVLLRGILSPLGHGTWTAIFAAVLFRESRNCCFRVNNAVIGAYLTVSVLHGLWDGLPDFLSHFTPLGLDYLLGQLAIASIGLWILRMRWKEALIKTEMVDTKDVT
jgi:RsiW-degrading membrane proteinase PrsW (M82 family)